MDTPPASKRLSGILIFTFGIFLSTLLTAALTWASFEAAFYGFQRLAIDPFKGLTCPPLMTSRETGVILMEVENPTGKAIEPVLRIDTSTSLAPESKQTQVRIEPGEVQQFSQTVSAANIDLKFFIFAKAYRYPVYPLPTVEATCGILVVNLPFLSGRLLYLLWLGLSLAAVPLGLWWWSSTEARMTGKAFNAAKALAVIALAGLLISAQGNWLAGVLVLVLTLLLASAILRLVTQK